MSINLGAQGAINEISNQNYALVEKFLPQYFPICLANNEMNDLSLQM